MAILDTPASGKIKGRYEELTADRNKYRDRAREYAKVTLPYLLPETEETGSVEFQQDYNTEGAKLVNSLANKYVSTLFPAGRSFMRIDMDEETAQEQQNQGNSKAGMEALFATVERDFRRKFEAIGSRPVLLDSMKHLSVTGNVCLYAPQDGLLQNYALDEYAQLISLDGQLQELITEDKKKVALLEPEIQAAVVAEMELKEEEDWRDTTVSLYTYIRRDPNDTDSWAVDQAVEAIPVGEQNLYKTSALRWLPVMWQRTRREGYGRGLVEEHYGSFWTLSILTEAVAVGCVTMADIKFLVRPGSLIDVAALNSSATGSYHYGEPDDIQGISSDKSRDIVMIKDVIADYRRHLGEVFMYAPSTMRDAERVTAEETRMRARELENAHGGVYSALAITLQKPLATLIFNEMNVEGLDSNGINMTITTGLDALARGNENDKINHWLSDIAQTNNLPEDVRARFKMSEFLAVTAAGRDVDFSKFVMSEEDYAAQQQEAAAAQQQGMATEELAKKAEPEQLAGALQQ